MATNLRLRDDAARALQAEAQRTGQSQQQIIREAVDEHLGIGGAKAAASALGDLIATGTVLGPRSPYQRATRRLKLTKGTTSLDLLDRSDRL